MPSARDVAQPQGDASGKVIVSGIASGGSGTAEIGFRSVPASKPLLGQTAIGK